MAFYCTKKSTATRKKDGEGNTSQSEAMFVNGIHNLVNFFFEVLDQEYVGMRAMPPFELVFYLNKFLVKKILLGHEAFQIIFSHNKLFFSTLQKQQKSGGS